ncbi:MAG: hypothetical protein BHV87_05165 [Clostridiales bacterium 36_14]|nr:MAG: hypothetical protein BHV87_05165 [Clostridiales bacterium 36_14]
MKVKRRYSVKQEIICDVCGEDCGITSYRIQFSEIYHDLEMPVGDIQVCDDCVLRIGEFIQKMKGVSENAMQ